MYLITAIPFFILHVTKENYLLAGSLLSGTFVLLGVRKFLRATKKHRISFIFAAYFILPIFLINYITGGIDNNGPLWYYAYPMVTLHLLGPRNGSLAAISLLLVSVILLINPFNELMMTRYKTSFLVRFFKSYSIVYALAFAYEFQKQRNRKQIKELRDLLPICASCKKIRDDKGYWNQIEVYIENHSEVEFSHGICSECEEKLYGEQEWYKKAKKKRGLT